MNSTLANLLRNAVRFLFIALPVWLFVQGVLALLFVCHTGASTCGVTLGDAAVLYLSIGVPMLIGFLVHYFLLVLAARLTQRVPPRWLAIVLAIPVPLSVLLTGVSPALFTIWHSTLGILAGIVVYGAIMLLPRPDFQRAPA